MAQRPGGPHDPKLAIIQAAVALVLLAGLPVVIEAPSSSWGMAGLAIAALALLAFLVEGVARFMRSRRRAFHDSILPPPEQRSPPKKAKPGD